MLKQTRDRQNPFQTAVCNKAGIHIMHTMQIRHIMAIVSCCTHYELHIVHIVHFVHIVSMLQYAHTYAPHIHFDMHIQIFIHKNVTILTTHTDSMCFVCK